MLETMKRLFGRGAVDTVKIAKASPETLRWRSEIEQGLSLDPSIRSAIAIVSERMACNTDPHPSPRYATVADHFRGASSREAKLALLEYLVRAAGARQILEIGTAYGLSGIALTMAQEVPALTTLDGFEPQASLGPVNIRSVSPQGVEAIKGDKNDTLPRLAAEGRRYDFVFHDGGHDGDAYVRDFEVIQSMMQSGAIYIIDDITWDKRPDLRRTTRERSRRTCQEGWEEVLAHPRVAGALTVNDLGVLVLT
jgi:predicted O-methyltransferase YrrM